MQTFLIVMGSLVTSSLLWITPLLLLDRNKPDEDVEDQPQASNESDCESEVEEQVFADEILEEADVKAFHACRRADKLMNVAVEKNIVSNKNPDEFAFSIN